MTNNANTKNQTDISIVGLLVHAKTEKLGSVQMQLAQLKGVEVHAVIPDGRLILTVDESNSQIKGESMMRLYDIDGVLSASLIYHHFENDVANQEALL
ncbi:MAG: chaperone NapD [Thiohalomonadaceae bacterium]